MAISVSLYLDTRNKKRSSITPESKLEGQKTHCVSPVKYPVKIAITKDGSTAYLATGLKLLPEQWKAKKVTGRKDKAMLNSFLDSLAVRVQHIIIGGINDGRYLNMSATEIKNDVSVALTFTHQRNKVTPFFPVYYKFSESRRSDRTKEIYRVTGRKLAKLLPTGEKLTFEMIDLTWLENLDEVLEQSGNNATTRNLDFRNIRAVINYAIKHRLIHENPFDEFDIPRGESPNRALTIEQLRLLINAEVEPWEEKYLDFFILSFLLIGMNTEDILHVTQIENGRINYIRAKTGKSLSVRVEKEALAIINKYPGRKYLLNILDSYSRTHNWTAKVDKALKRISSRIGLPEITMYWARHTWATIANIDLGIDFSVVSDALGHQAEKGVTSIYIKKKDYQRIDKANRSVIDYVFHL